MLHDKQWPISNFKKPPFTLNQVTTMLHVDKEMIPLFDGELYSATSRTGIRKCQKVATKGVAHPVSFSLLRSRGITRLNENETETFSSQKNTTF